jgi:Family of unknown function (DUF6325)
VIGPVQVLVLGFEGPTFTGEVSAELSRLREAGIVRLIDLLLVSRDDEGTLEVLAPPAELPDTGRLAAAVLGEPEDSAEGREDPVRAGVHDPTWSLADAIPIGTTAAVALIEHTWAAPLRAAIRRSGGVPLDETWLAGEDLELLDDLLTPLDSGRKDET